MKKELPPFIQITLIILFSIIVAMLFTAITGFNPDKNDTRPIGVDPELYYEDDDY
ncbi:hypothetical protein HN014_10795 [Aquimarina sp. TRL1]|uniref:hypothetical protein n=1 Tax=Aquimarina sp. (strain TRL1) TaxID=2736252 RepID=UPI00158B6F59|nr:hypothetical protein [Aquimarina sp. TRL1]QKX05380.1 hypothetical protein HN014_10795 [Aquimarina sp. TRL1]